MEENSKTEESLEFEKGNVFKESYKQRDGFQKFWTKDKTEALLRILSAQAEVGEVHHGKVAKLLNEELQLESEVKVEQVVDRISLLVSSFKREIEKEERVGLPSSWRWKKQMRRLSEKLKRNQTSESELEPPKKKQFSVEQREVKIASGSDEAKRSGGERLIDASQVDAGLFELDKKNQSSSFPAQNLTLSGPERRGRMPDAHVEILLDCYKFVLQNRMLSSGRLGKGSFQEVADEMNRRCGLDGDGTYEREQLAAKLQNLKTQFRNRKQAVDDGRESGSLWKWYQTMDDLSNAEFNLRESFDSAPNLSYRLNSVNYQNSPLSASQEDDQSISRDERFDLNYENSDSTFSRKEKRELTRGELEDSLGNLAMLLFNKDENSADESESEDTVDRSDCNDGNVSRQLNNMRSSAMKLLTGFSALISHVEAE